MLKDMKKVNIRNVTQSKENLISESENDISDHAYDNTINDEIAEVEVYTHHSNENETDLSYEDKNYIMQKFLENKPPKYSSEDSHPIPKRRINKKTLDHDENSTIVKHFDDDEDEIKSNISKTSNATYDIFIPIPKKRSLNEEKKCKEVESASTSKKSNSIEMKEFIKYESEKKSDKNEEVKKKLVCTEDETDLTPTLTQTKGKRNQNKEKTRKKVTKSSKRINSNVSDDEKDVDEAETANQEHKRSNKEDVQEILAVKISKTDSLLLHSYVLHPIVRMHLVDSENGEYIKKSDPRRNVVLTTEDFPHDDFITTTMTKPYHLIQNRQLIPNWNEVLFINEDFKYLSNLERLIIFFEIVEYSFPQATAMDLNEESRYIAWAFLKPQKNYNQNIRLQLYYPQNKNASKCRSYKWWKKHKMRKYPSTLYVSLNKTNLPNKILKMWTTKPLNDMDHMPESKECVEININEELPVLKKLENHICKIPKEKLFEIKACDEGCFTHKFSKSGDYLAIAISEDNLYSIIIYSVRNQEEFFRLESHHGLIYDLTWTRNDRQLMSASADCTVAIWDITLQKLEHILPHPTFVYCCACTNDNCIATGSYDKCIRIWSLTSYTLLDELTGHKGYITSVCFNKDCYFMYSADSSGCIKMWQKEQNAWIIKQEINVLDLKDVIINQVFLHKRERRLIVNSRDGFIRLIDIKTSYVLQTYTKGSKEKTRTICDVTPCDTYLVSGTEAGDLFIWNVDSGKVEQVLSPYHIKIPIHCVQFHQKDNLLAISHYGNNLPLLIYGSKGLQTEEQQNENSSQQSQHLLNTKANCKTDFVTVRQQGTNFRLILEKFDNIINISS